MDVVFTKHAHDRLDERVNYWRKIPLEKIRRAALCHAGKFFVRQGAMTYVCDQDGDRIVVITIIKNLKNKN